MFEKNIVERDFHITIWSYYEILVSYLLSNGILWKKIVHDKNLYIIKLYEIFS